MADASAFLAVILNEPERDDIICALEGKEILSVGCLSWEIGNAFTAMLKRKRLTEEQIMDGWNIYEEIVWRSVKANIPNALRLSAKHNLYAYDAYYIEAASRHGCPLLSLDLRMNEVGKLENINVLEVSL